MFAVLLFDQLGAPSGMQHLDLPQVFTQVEHAWANPVRRFNVDAKDVGGMSKIQGKLERIIIPKLEFKEATIAEALSFLRKKSVELDPDEPYAFVDIAAVCCIDVSVRFDSSITLPLAILNHGDWPWASSTLKEFVNAELREEMYLNKSV